MTATVRRMLTLAAALALGAGSVAISAQQIPAPRPFPGSGPARPVDPTPQGPAPLDPAPREPAPPTSIVVPEPTSNDTRGNQPPPGLPVYPTAEFIAEFDAGQGQRYYLFGSDMPYDDIVAYYRSVVGGGGRELFREPPTRQWDLGRFQENSMVYPPSVVVKDYAWNGGTGYLAVSGTTERRYRTVIQIVPPPSANQ